MKELITFFFLTAIVLNGYSQNISFDNTFANNGVLKIPSSATSEVNDMDIDPNGNIFSASTTSQGSGTGIYKLTVSKSSSLGILDIQFANNGISKISVAHSEYPLDIKALTNSKILVCGSAYTGNTPNGPGLHIGFILKLNSDGNIDTSFANNGVLKLDNIASHFTSINILNNNSILLSGNINNQAAILKLSENGVIDTQFGSNGILYLSSSNFNFILWQSILNSNNELISVGYDFTNSTNPKIAYCKTDTLGNFITSFGTNGKVVIDLYNGLPNTNELVTAIRKVGVNYYLAGYYISNFIIRIDENGNWDNSFATSGILVHSYPFRNFDIQNNGKILICGNKLISNSNYGYSIVRYNNDGSFDSTFNNGSSFDIDISSNNDYLQNVKFSGQNTLYLGGSSYENNISKSTIVKLNVNATLSLENIYDATSLYIYPNPFKDYLIIDGKDKLKDIKLFDITGKQIKIEQLQNRITFKETISNGIYFIWIETENGKQIIKKIIKE